MHAQIGDEIIVDSVHMGEPPRKGEVLKVIVSEHSEHYLVRWDDTGHKTIFFPGSTSHALRLARAEQP